MIFYVLYQEGKTILEKQFRADGWHEAYPTAKLKIPRKSIILGLRRYTAQRAEHTTVNFYPLDIIEDD
jgi:hypothetical protein